MLPSRRLKFLFWIILGAFSVFFAEVVSGSDMFPYYNLWGIIAVLPLYTMHILALSYIVYYYGKPRLYTLFLAGGIFGLYEAYITKVMWDPPWFPSLFKMYGVAVWEVFVLVFFLHSFMAFIIPLVLCESVLTSSRDSLHGLTDRIKSCLRSKKKAYALFAFFAVVFGLVQSVNSRSFISSLLSGFSSGALLIILIFIWRNVCKGNNFGIKELLPNKGEFKVLLVILLIFYVTTTFYIRPDALPGILPQSIIWVLYLMFFILLFISLKKSGKMDLSETPIALSFSWKAIIALFMIFTLTSAFAELFLSHLGDLWVILLWFIGGIFGVVVFLFAVLDLFKRKS
jgi:hypothetical protein